MSLTRRLAAGLPAVGVSALAALAFTGAPAYATGDVADRAGQIAATATPCPDPRTKCDGYGPDDETPATPPMSPAPTDDNGTDDNGSGNGPGAGADNGGADDDDDRGNPGYGGESPATTPPTGTTDTVPPGGVSPATSPATPGGVSAGGTLPLTGAPMAATVSLGALLVAGGAFTVWYTRRRRTA
ncbi:hypothetical protein [Jidongwangia harbinensis]|uniref:hypothetical protein n=1 Tax=Jidongwangia harbinensis TaxID=2878561 RepID=UPI001CD9AFC2|nr:hypothetical protein [Jidongwangia harbinensis]MCA2216129.1 hypothetical protein [Jidongwangia harbinensis]